MMSISQFRIHLFKCFELMDKAGATFKVAYRRKVYEISVKATGEKLTTPYKKARARKVLYPLKVESSKCPICGDLMLQGECMSRNKKAHAEAQASLS